MSNIIPFDQAPAPQFANRRSEMTEAAIRATGPSFAAIGVKGKEWTIRYRGESQPVLADDGRSPAPMLAVVVVGVSKHLSNQWYEGGYQDESNDRPACAAIKGDKPDATSPNPQNPTCAGCRRSVFTPVTLANGKTGGRKECQTRKRIAVVPLDDITNEAWGGPMLLNMSYTSSVKFSQYAQMLARKGAAIEAVATGMRFTPGLAYPQIEFEALGWLSPEQAEQVVGPDGNSGICAHPNIQAMLYDPSTSIVDVSDVPLIGFPKEVEVKSKLVSTKAPAPAALPAPAPKKTTPFKNGSAPAPEPETVSEAEAEDVVEAAPANMLSAIDELLSRSVRPPA